jgi:hypothetical protein
MRRTLSGCSPGRQLLLQADLRIFAHHPEAACPPSGEAEWAKILRVYKALMIDNAMFDRAAVTRTFAFSGGGTLRIML